MGNISDRSNTMRFSAGGAKHTPQVSPGAYKLPQNFKPGQGNNAVLPKAHGDAVLNQVNSARTTLRGVNAKHIPPGQVSVNRDGGLNIAASGGRSYKVRQDGTLASYSERGKAANFRTDGSIRSLHAGGMEVNRGPHNERSIVTVRPDKSLLVSTGPHSGYLQRTFVHNNQTFVHRSYVDNNIIHRRFYRPYTYNGVAMHSYIPGKRYPPGFYRWAHNPWRAPVRYSWSGNQAPTLGFYGSYFTPLSVYSNPALWLTDFLLAESLRAAYLSSSEEQYAEQAVYSQAESPITSETRETIAMEVRQQIEQERIVAENPGQSAYHGDLATAISDSNHLFIVSSNLDVTAGGQECGLTAGDILRLNGAPADGAQSAELQVVSSKRNNCPARSVVTVSLNDLQEMHNSMRERIYDGLDLLRQSNGSNGIPEAPRDALYQPRKNEPADLGSKDDNVLTLLKNQQGEADQAETQVIQSAFTEEQAMNY